MMKSAEDGPCGDLAAPLDRPMAWRRVVGRKDPAQMGFAKDDHVIESFPADRTDQSLRMPIPPG